jgi:type IV pilus assembly protein PilY1
MNGGGNASSTFSRVDIVPGTTSYSKAATRTDCAGSTCTYDEEMTNFANWFTYYRTRIQMMKSAAGRAFTGIGSNFRVGFVTINSASSNYLKIDDYDTTQKSSWYTKLYGISPSGSTPLRTALTTAGRIFAGKNPLGASGGDDPMQYSCQQNFTLITTDGYWNDPNESTVVQINGTTQVNNQDNNSATMPRPMYDGNGSALSCPSGATCLGAGSAGSNSSSSYSSVNTLADVAAYYYNTDLRTSTLSNCTSPSTSADVCANNVPGGGNDTNSQQHMTTFTLGLGIDGSLTYQSDYASATSGDYYQISQGTKDWPQAKHDDPTAIDDLWHAAVNGRGVYFSARDPNALASGLNSALSGVSARLGSGAAAATSNLEPVAGDNYAYVASYTTVQWYGNLESRTVDTQTGVVSPQAVWCVEDVVADPSTGATACTGVLKTQVGAVSDSRNIYTFSASGAGKLRSFTWGNLTATEQGYFSTALLSQYSTWSATDKTLATGATLVNYLRGQTGFENQTGSTAMLYRDRQKTLGDVVGSQPVYVKKPYFSYSDPGYTDYVTAKSSRAPTVYIGANDGMLHAFNADNGSERWAYIPTPLLPKLYKLADSNYSTQHQFYADGPVVVGDICVSSCDTSSASWKTILVGGLNGGGRGYYALDITDPTAPAALWELTTSVDSDIGYSYGNPIITKDNTGKWVVLFASGYNNVSPGSGNGILFVLDAATGSIIRKVNTGGGGTSSPSGLAKIAGWASNPAGDNSVTYAYGGDLDGSLWRFDPNAGTAVKIAALTSSGGTAQPITSRPELTDIAGTKMVFVATGKLLETTDLSSTGSNSIYGIKDVYDTSGTLTSPHTNLIQQTLTNGTNASGAAIRTGSSNAVNLSTDRGWYIDLPDSGERSNIDMQLVAGSLLVPTNVPSTSVCYAAGYGWLNYLDYKTGGFQTNATNGYAGTKAGNALIVGMVVMKLATGFVVNATLSDNPTPVKMTNISVGGSNTGLTGKRTSWREIQ